MKKIAVIGTGYVGLVTGASLADFGYDVTCVDIDEAKIASLKQGRVPFFEPGLQELVERGIEARRLSFEIDLETALKGALYCFLALPTPSSIDQSCDLQYVLTAARSVAQKMSGPLIVINKSTVPVGTAKEVHKTIEEEMEKGETAFPFSVVSNPEFLREGSAVHDFKQPKRILIGADNTWAEEQMRELYSPFADKLIVTDVASSELAKYAANAMLAMRLTMINTFSQLCETLGGDIEAIQTILGKDPRIGSQYLSPGVGFGGSCLPKDVRALSAICQEVGHPSGVFDEILRINEAQQQSFFDKIVDYYSSNREKTLAIWGLSFKPDTDDVRESPAIALCQKLTSAGFTLRLYDPAAMGKLAHLASEKVSFCETEVEAATGSDGIVLMTDWKRFSFVDFAKLAPLMRSQVLFDGRNQLTSLKLHELGFDYLPIGKAPTRQVALS